ncbi:hypothetical protein, partial [Streptomyces sp. NPDC005568]|uniref:hypothetical protein n=1 Tax=Streptomyces sp. NPDC005568 TaxID=3156887 RepID=UPI00339E98A9
MCASRGPRPSRRRCGGSSVTRPPAHGEPLIPVYVFYSMFGFQRTGDQFWQMADQL